MKLFDKYNRINIGVTIIIMLVTGIVYYYTISHILTGQIDKDLVLEENEAFSYVSKNHRLPDVYESNHQQIVFAPLGQQSVQRRFLDTVYRDYDEKDLEAARALISSVKVSGQNYSIVVTQSKVEIEDLIQIIFLITIGVIITLLAILIILNRVILKSIWKPFYKVLFQLKEFSLASNPIVSSTLSTIDEFTELNQAVISMADRVKSDYQNLKGFTENASHELMTPISIINSKLDTLLQTDEFTDKQSKLLNDIYGTVTRLTRLNKSMLLLAKIENGLIKDIHDVDIKEVLEECLYQHEEMIQQLNIKLASDLHDKKIHANKSLIEILLNNLLSNAIRHNYHNGQLSVILDAQKLTITNTGKGSFNFDQVLKRFHKSDGSEGIGLGLTLCKQICDNYGFTLGYEQDDKMHTFSVIF
ncbi:MULTISPECIES: HAMP domain-containing sensor histidine kinase [unclassified Mucilaginibacter]|uniref:sensor histidine kinase n=1 Tax=unclassified Mucilaginibacter TaxID=2617802 RepID=UPI002AC99398|nr:MULTISPECIES: HAMP domain-containing sensor histidine kinase [unclassified Mucilaginibacter]MEB0262218.1 HAMP domain-containing sensor histidine kinase [Mucilaginibacter sp. 10I4]MEB0278667.1 HAMP domain-containing sensor histidine kinase [Mucilaginibacter sp. 10B2]MEB0299377.1 HAMP domain-containing sensor histidine kinase [Mucilaginibacter sp. 5C4]WPX23381.1 HAMP domain-containing sensor histidine kinase [Mucilaginibacter sp. 5C4]